MLNKLDHDNIIKYFCLYKPSVIPDCPNVYEYGLLMEYLAGGSLK